ncbi:MAG: DUF1877 family protein [Rivularia sp. (in: Bacteria)]|nr:DUF1877 family protein [Rivularia sp. MS3]
MSTTAEFSQISTSLLEVLINYPDFTEFYLGWESWNDLSYAQLKKLRNLPKNIYSILEKGMEESLDINKAWYFFHYLFTGYEDSYMKIDNLISINKKDKLPLINTVLGGKQLKANAGYDDIRYLTATEVNQIANALSKLKLGDVVQRLQDKDCYHDYIFDSLSEYCYYDELVNYYKDAAVKGNAMLLWLN